MKNDRMHELYAQACLYARDKQLDRKSEDKDVPEFIECMTEKFAELVVRECAKVVFEKTGPKSALNVLEHFGVEE